MTQRYKVFDPQVPLTGEQQQALAQWARDYKKAQPAIESAARAAQRIFYELINQPGWRIAETQMPPGQQRPQESLWSVKPTVNYVDHIEHADDPAAEGDAPTASEEQGE